MPQREVKIDCPKQLLVEGRDEELLLNRLIRHLHIEDLQVQNYQGKNNLGNFLQDMVVVVGFNSVQTMGIVQDADECAHSALQSIQSHLQNANLPVPTTFLVPTESTPITSIFVVPDNSGGGALEHLCLSALAEDPAMPCVDEFITCIEKAGCSTPENRKDKARIHAFLASRQDPELRLGEAAQRGYIPWNHPAFAQLAQFLQSL